VATYNDDRWLIVAVVSGGMPLSYSHFTLLEPQIRLFSADQLKQSETPFLSLFRSLYPSLFLSLCISLPLSASLSLPLSASLYIPLSFSLSLSLSHTRSLTLSHSLSLSLPSLLFD